MVSTDGAGAPARVTCVVSSFIICGSDSTSSFASLRRCASRTGAKPGSCEGLQLAVYDIDATRADLTARGIEVSEPFHDATGVFHHAGREGRVDGPAPDHADYGSFAAFSDPDGNGWLLQEIRTRLPGR